MILKTAWTLLGAVLLIYGGVCAWMYANQRALMYYPQATRVAAASTDFALQREEGVTLRGWLPNPDARRAAVYFGGNGEDISANRALFRRALPDHAVYLVAYRGYGGSDGEPAQSALLADALAIFDEARRRHPAAAPVVIGRSLGSGVASYVAGHGPVERLVLVTPFDSLADVAQAHYPSLPVRWLLRERYPSTDWLRAYRGRLLIVRADRDTVVPPARTDALITALARTPHVASMPKAGHNDLDQTTYAKELAGFFGSRLAEGTP